MNERIYSKPANEYEMILYCCMGEAVCKVQILEDALSASITIKKHPRLSRTEADKALEKQRKQYTLGKAVLMACKENLIPSRLQAKLKEFYKRRNWLIHQVMVQNLTRLGNKTSVNTTIEKIRSIAIDAEIIQREIEMDLMDFCEANGKDMSKIRMTINEYK